MAENTLSFYFLATDDLEARLTIIAHKRNICPTAAVPATSGRTMRHLFCFIQSLAHCTAFVLSCAKRSESRWSFRGIIVNQVYTAVET